MEEMYPQMKAILSAVPELHLHEAHGKQFKFPVYMTDTLAETDIAALELGVRSYNCLKRAGIFTVGQLCDYVMNGGELSKIRNCGKRSVAEIWDHLFAYQFSVLRSERRGKFISHVVEMNLK